MDPTAPTLRAAGPALPGRRLRWPARGRLIGVGDKAANLPIRRLDAGQGPQDGLMMRRPVLTPGRLRAVRGDVHG